jgi:hypothetical protein
MYPGVYPLARPLDALPCPVIPLGLGWKGPAGDAYAVHTYRFTSETLQALRWMAGRTASLGCRDRLTERVLRRQGFRGVSMVGCPVWYDLDSIGKAPELPRAVARVVFTPAQRHELHDQSIEVARRIAEALPAAEKIACFHRGLDESGPWVSEADAANNRSLACELDALGFDVADVTGDTSKIRFYDECSLHVGYRVHAHLWFLSRRKPSLLIEEDGRGAGVSETLGVTGVAAFGRGAWGQRLRRWLPEPVLNRVPGIPQPYCIDEAAPAHLDRLLREDLEAGFQRFAGVGRTLDRYFSRMRDFVRELP